MASSVPRLHVYDENARENTAVSGTSASSSSSSSSTTTKKSSNTRRTGVQPTPASSKRKPLQPKTPVNIRVDEVLLKDLEKLHAGSNLDEQTARRSALADFSDPSEVKRTTGTRAPESIIAEDNVEGSVVELLTVAPPAMTELPSSSSSLAAPSSDAAPSVTPRKGTFGVKKLFFGTGFQRAARVKQNEQKQVEELPKVDEEGVASETESQHEAPPRPLLPAAAPQPTTVTTAKRGSSKEKKEVRFVSPADAPTGPRVAVTTAAASARRTSLGPVVRPGSLSPTTGGPTLTKSATAGAVVAPPPPQSAFKPALLTLEKDNADYEMQTPMPGASSKPRVLYRQSPARMHSPGVPRSIVSAPETGTKFPAGPDIDQTPTVTKGKRRKQQPVAMTVVADENSPAVDGGDDDDDVVVVVVGGAGSGGSSKDGDGGDAAHDDPLYNRRHRANDGARPLAPQPRTQGEGAPTTGKSAGTSRKAVASAAPVPSVEGDAVDGSPIVTAKPGDTLSLRGRKLTVLEKVGSGGYSTVYKVLDQETFEIFACKDVYKHRSDTTAFMNEIQILMRIIREKRANPEVRNTLLQLISYEETPTRGLVLFEYGELDLTRIQQRFLNQRDPASPLVMGLSHLRVYWEQMLKCVAQLHALKIVHCDLKPANFVLVKGRVKLIDFGIAVDETQSPAPHSKGTLSYLPPELCTQILRREKVDVPRDKRDIWALGCILFEFAFGKTPFKKKGIDDPEESKRDILTTVADPHHVIPFPEGSRRFASLQNCISVCLRYTPETRPHAALLLKHQFLTVVDEAAE